VLGTGPVHFVYYGAQDPAIDHVALNGIRDGMTLAGVKPAHVFASIGEADYDGDGKADIAVWARSTAVWSIRRSSDGGLTEVGFGAPRLGDIPVPANYFGNNRADIAVYRVATGEWHIYDWSVGYVVVWGASPGAPPVPQRRPGAGGLRR
jgi:hypothetical protein